MRRFLKFLHEIGSIGFLGAVAALIVLHASVPDPSELERFAALRVAMDSVARWLLLPSMAIVVLSGLLSVAIVPAFHSADWVWAKLAMGVLIFEVTFAAIQVPIGRAAEAARAALVDESAVAELAALAEPLSRQWGSLWFIGAIAVANVVLGVWRPRFGRRRAKRASS
jgi:hypothetical protein